jgi:uncharacterized membrane protein YqjE
MATEENGQRNSSTGELVKQLSDQLSTLIRRELDLAKAELTEKGKAAGTGAGMFGGAGVVALLALGALTAAVILLLDKGMEAWLAALIVAVLYGAGAAVLALAGRDRVKAGMPPAEQTIETVKEDVQWAKSQARSARR